MRVRVRPLLVVGVALLLGCGPFSPSASGPDLLRRSLATYQKAQFVHVSGLATQGSTKYTFVFTSARSGDAQGTLNVADSPLEFVRVAGTDYVSDAATISKLTGLSPGGLWVKGLDLDVTRLIDRLSDRAGLAASLRAAGADMKVAGDASGGTQKLAGSRLTALVSTSADNHPTHVETGSGVTLDDGLTDVHLDLSDFGKAASINPPDAARVADAHDPNSFPALFQEDLGSGSFDNCDDNGCTISASFTNKGGHVGQAIAVFTVRQGGSIVATCQVNIPQTDHNASTRAGCRADYNRVGVNSTGTVAVTNPNV